MNYQTRITDYAIQGPASYQTEIEAAQTLLKGKDTWTGITAEAIARMRLQNRFKTGLDIARYTAAVMRADMAAYDKDSSKYTQSLGVWHGFVAQQKMISIKKHFAGSTDRRYMYLSGWMIAALRSEFGPLPDQSMHEKTSVPALIKELYTFLKQADARELNDIFREIDAARKAGDKATVERLHADRSAERARLSESDVVEQNDHDVRRALGRRDGEARRRLRVAGGELRDRRRLGLGDRQHAAIELLRVGRSGGRQGESGNGRHQGKGSQGGVSRFPPLTRSALRILSGRDDSGECDRSSASRVRGHFTRGGRCAAVVIFRIFPHRQARENVSPTLAPTSTRLATPHFSQVHSTGRIWEPTKSCQNWRQLPRPDQPSWTVTRPLSSEGRADAATSLAECKLKWASRPRSATSVTAPIFRGGFSPPRRRSRGPRGPESRRPSGAG